MSSPSSRGILQRLWQHWKTLRLPWRKQFLVGADLSGNTFWEFKDQLNANRLRRIVKYSRKAHFADVRISPQWHQWLRHTRHEAPTIQEQQYEVSRQAMMKQLAAEADERWRSQPSYLDSPNKQQPAPAVALNDSKPPADSVQDESTGVKSAVGAQQEVGEASRGHDQADGKRTARKEKEANPWNRPQAGAPGEQWQPETWLPGVAQRR